MLVARRLITMISPKWRRVTRVLGQDQAGKGLSRPDGVRQPRYRRLPGFSSFCLSVMISFKLLAWRRS